MGFFGVLGLVGGWFDKLDETWKAIVALLGAAGFGASMMLAGMSYVNLPEDTKQNKASIDSLAKEVNELETTLQANRRNDVNFRESISRRIELMCREILEDPTQCELRFEGTYPSLQGTSIIIQPVTKDETQQEMRQSGVRKFRTGQREVLRRLRESRRNDGSQRAGRRATRRSTGRGDAGRGDTGR